MEIIKLPRGAGKTWRLIKWSADSGAYIVCPDRKRARRIFSEAQKMCYNIPFPITATELFHHEYYAKGVKKVLIDDADDVLQMLCPDLIIEGITLTG